MKIFELEDGTVSIILENEQEKLWLYALSNTSVSDAVSSAELLNVDLGDELHHPQRDLYFGMKNILGVE